MSVRFGTTRITGPTEKLQKHLPAIDHALHQDKLLAQVPWTFEDETQGDQTTFTVHVPKPKVSPKNQPSEALLHEAHMVFLIHQHVTKVPKSAKPETGSVDVQVQSDCLLADRIKGDFARGPHPV